MLKFCRPANPATVIQTVGWPVYTLIVEQEVVILGSFMKTWYRCIAHFTL